LFRGSVPFRVRIRFRVWVLFCLVRIRFRVWVLFCLGVSVQFWVRLRVCFRVHFKVWTSVTCSVPFRVICRVDVLF